LECNDFRVEVAKETNKMESKVSPIVLVRGDHRLKQSIDAKLHKSYFMLCFVVNTI
jgi:hypothetical protein